MHIGDEMENRKSIDLDLERRDFEASGICTTSMFENVMWDQWQFKYVPLVREKKICDNAIKINDRFLGWKAAKSQATPEGFVLVPVKEIKTWFLDESENIYREDPDWLCDIPIGEVVEVEHRVSYELEQDPVFAAIQWDEINGDVGNYETFDTKEEAEKVAAHCKAMVEVQEKTHD